jgi:uncharacterized iron-regulated protein
MMKFLILLACLIFSSLAHASNWNGKILISNSQREIGLSELAMNLVFARNVILGEKHNTPAVQLAQAKVMESVVALAPQDRMTTAWEFLNYTDQPKIEGAFQQFSTGMISAEEFLTLTQGSAKYKSYAPILEVTKKFHGQLIGVNLSRADKDPVTQGGIANAKPGTVPVGFEMGGKNYFERFVVSMQGHATEEQIQNYFASQCLTDDVIAEKMLLHSAADRRFLVVGSFHSDYFDGVVTRLMKRAPDQPIAVVRFVDASDYSESELQGFANDPKYGPVADFVYFVNEPKQ